MRLDPKTLRALSLVSGLGFSIAVCLVASVLAGHWLDDQFRTQPLFLIVGILLGLLGVGAMIYSLIGAWKKNEGD